MTIKKKQSNNSLFSCKNKTSLGLFKILSNFIILELRNKSTNFKIGVFSIFLVVSFVTLLINILKVTPSIFISLSERSRGDADFVLLPLNSSQTQNPMDIFNLLINHNEVDKVCEYRTLQKYIYGCTPRWALVANIKKYQNSSLNYNQNNKSLRSFVLIYDEDQEESIGIGRNMRYLNKLNISQSHINSDPAIYLGFKLQKDLQPLEKQYIEVQIDLFQTLNQQQNLNFDLFNNFSNLNGSNKQLSQEEQIQQLKQSVAKYLSNYLEQQYQQSTGTELATQILNTSILKEQSDKMYDYLQDLQKQNFSVLNTISKWTIEQSMPTALKNFIKNLSLIDSIYEPDKYLPIKQVIDTLDDNQQLNLSKAIDDMSSIILDSLNLTMILEIVDIPETTQGKWPSGLGSVITLNSKFIMKTLSDSILYNIQAILSNQSIQGNQEQRLMLGLLNITGFGQITQQNINNFNLNQYSLMEYVSHRNKIQIYESAEKTKNYFIKFSNLFYSLLGKNHKSQSSTPLLETMVLFQTGMHFVENIIYSTIFLLAVLSALLIYSLMIQNIHEKSYEYGMIRALGLNSQNLLILMLVQGLIYAISGTLLAMIFCNNMSMLYSFYMFDKTQLSLNYSIQKEALIIGMSLGLIMPLISNIIPISKSLQNSLRDSLDLYQRKINEFIVRIKKLEKMGLSLSQSAIALTLILTGLISYYFIPMSFVYQNIKLFLMILNVILMLLIAGVTILANLWQGPIEKIIIFIIFLVFKFDKAIKIIVQKNMKAHYQRNMKTALIYSLVLSFLLFAGAGLKQQIGLVYDTMKFKFGSTITAISLQNDDMGLDEFKIRQYLENYQKINPGNIISYSIVSMTLHSQPGLENLNKQFLSSISGEFIGNNINYIYGVDENLLDSSYFDYYFPSEYDKEIKNYEKLENGIKNGLSSLFSKEYSKQTKNYFEKIDKDYYQINSNFQLNEKRNLILKESLKLDPINIMISEGLRRKMSTNVGSSAIIILQSKNNQEQFKFKAYVRHMASKFPFFTFSKYSNTYSTIDLIMPMESFKQIMDFYIQNANYTLQEKKHFEYKQQRQHFNLSYGILKNFVFIKMNKNCSEQVRNIVLNALKSFFTNDLYIAVDVEKVSTLIGQTMELLNLFYIVVATIAIVIAFFLILTSIQANVKENQWEIGVYRAIGITKSQLTRIYAYESIALIIASCIIGTFCGIVIAITISYQFVMIIEFPFKLFFPTEQLLFTILLGIFTSLLASLLAINKIKQKTIANIFKVQA